MKIEGTKQNETFAVGSNTTVPAESEDAARKLKASFNYAGMSGGADVQVENKPPKFDFTGFKKGDRAHANEYAARALNEIKDVVRSFNRDFPTNPFIVDYRSFPNPKDFDEKNLGGKSQAYEAWKDAVNVWVEDIKQDLEAKKSRSAEELHQETLMHITNSFCQIYIQMGLTREFIELTCEEFKGDVNSIKEQLDKAVKDINSNTNRQAGVIREELKEATKTPEEDKARSTEDAAESDDRVQPNKGREESGKVPPPDVEEDGAPKPEEEPSDKPREAARNEGSGLAMELVSEMGNLFPNNDAVVKILKQVDETNAYNFIGAFIASGGEGLNKQVFGLKDTLQKIGYTNTLDVMEALLAQARQIGLEDSAEYKRLAAEVSYGRQIIEDFPTQNNTPYDPKPEQIKIADDAISDLYNKMSEILK